MPPEKGKKGVKKKNIIIWCQHHNFLKHHKKSFILLLIAFDNISHHGGLEDGEVEKQSRQRWSGFSVVIFSVCGSYMIH